jgi:outer membrane beta-barrel protein
MKYLLLFLFLNFFFADVSQAGVENIYNYKWLGLHKKVFVLQKKHFVKEKTFFTYLGRGSNSSTEFQKTTSLSLAFGYFFKEEWGIEASYFSYSNSNNETFEGASSSSSNVPFVRRFNSKLGATVLYSPFYGKINTFNRIIYFELIPGIGISNISAEQNKDDFDAANSLNRFVAESLFSFHWKIELRTYINDYLTAHINYHTDYYSASSASSTSTSLQTSHDFVFSIGFIF